MKLRNESAYCRAHYFGVLRRNVGPDFEIAPGSTQPGADRVGPAARWVDRLVCSLSMTATRSGKASLRSASPTAIMIAIRVT